MVKLPVFSKYIPRDQCATRHVRSQEIQKRRMDLKPGPDGFAVTAQICVLDLAGLSLAPSSSGLNNFKDLVNIDQNYYPESLAHIFFLNTPWLFYPLWAIVRPWIDPVTVKKFHLLGSNYQDELLKYIPASDLPVEYGGESPYEVPRLESHDL